MSSVTTYQERRKKATRRAVRRLRTLCREAWASHRRPQPSKWCRSAVRLDRSYESSARIDLTTRPWWRRILRDVVDPDVRSVTVTASTQVGKTLTLMAALLYLAEFDPAPAMVVVPDEASAVEFRDRLYANASATIAAGGSKRLKVPPTHRWNSRYCDLGSMRVYLAWSGARQRLRGRPCRRVFCSEVDVYEGDKRAGDPIQQAHQRTKAFTRHLHYHESSPTEEPSPIAELERAATARYRWHAPCPKCGQWQEVRFFAKAGKGGVVGYLDASGEIVSPETARQQARYVCESGCELGNDQKSQFMESGRWVPFGCSVGTDGNLQGKEPTSRRSVGYHLWTAFSDSINWSDLAASYAEAHAAGKLRDWWGNCLGLAYRPKQRVPLWYDVGTRLAANHPRGTVAQGAWFLTAGIDVQGDNSGCRYVIRGWGPNKTSWLVQWGWIERGESDANDLLRSDLVEAGKQVLEQAFPVFGGIASPLGPTSLRVRLTCVDSGHEPKKVHDWMRSLPQPWVIGDGTERLRAVKGGRVEGARYQRTEVERNVRTGEAYEGGMVLWRLAVAEHYPEFHDRLFSDPTKPGAWYVTSDAATLGKSYLQQVCNLERRVEIDRNGRKKIVWAARDQRVPIDFADAEVYADFAAEMVVGDMGWSPEVWEQWRASRVASQQQTTERREVRSGETDYDLADR